MAPKDLYLYAHSYTQVVRLNLSKLRDGDCQFELLREYLRDMECPACMGLMRVNSKLYMFGGFFSGNGEPCLGAYRVDLTNEEKPLVPDVSVPKFVAPKLSPNVVTIEGKTYVFAIPSSAPAGRRFEVFDHSTLNWKPMEDPPLLETEDVEDFYHYFAWGHKILIHNCIRFRIFDTKKLIWEDGDSFFERWVNDGRPLPTGTAAEIEEGLYIAMSLYQDAVVVYECDPDDGLPRSHQVLEDFSDLISREVVPGYGRGCVAPIGNGRFCFLLCGGTFGARRTGTSFGEYAARLATFQVSSSLPGRLPVHIQCLECFDVKGDREFPLKSIVVMPDWSKKRAADYTESDALFDEVIINCAEADFQKKEKMSSSSSTTTGFLRYRSCVCDCGWTAAIRVTESEPNKGRLYFACGSASKTDKCAFWNWCNPVNPTTVGHSTRGKWWCNEDEGTTTAVAYVQNVEALQAQLSFLKKIILICFGIIFILILVK